MQVCLYNRFLTHQVNVRQSEHTASLHAHSHLVTCAGCTRIEDIPQENLIINLAVLERML